MEVSAAEQLFKRVDGGISSLLWIDHPRRGLPLPAQAGAGRHGLIFMLHDHGNWHGWPDTWDGLPVEFAGAVQGFGCLMQRARLEPVIGQAMQAEQSYRAEVEELDDGWRLTDSWGRKLRLLVGPARWIWEG